MKRINFSENQKSIMLSKIEFLETQLNQASKREQQLEKDNKQLRDALAELSSDKQHIIQMIHAEKDPWVLQLQAKLIEKTNEIQPLKSKLLQISNLNGEYQKQIRRMEQNMKEHIQSIQLSHERERKHLENKIECLQMILSKQQNTQIEAEMEELRSENRQLQKKLSQRNQVTQASRMNTSHIELESMIKTLDRKDTQFNLENIQNISFNRVPTQTDFSNTKSRVTMTRSRSRVNQARSVISSLYCEQCQQNYAPNEYYKHLPQHGEKGRLILQKLQIERKLKEKGQRKRLQQELNTIVVTLKDLEKRNCQSSRALIR